MAYKEATLAVSCVICQAPSGERCFGRRRARKTEPHSPRVIDGQRHKEKLQRAARRKAKA